MQKNRITEGTYCHKFYSLGLKPFFTKDSKGFKGILKETDLYPCPTEQYSEELYERFNKHWTHEIEKGTKPDIKLALVKTLKIPLCVGGIGHLLEGMLMLVQGILIYNFSSLDRGKFSNNTMTGSIIHIHLAYAFAISLITLYLTINFSIANYLLNCLATLMRSICITAIFKKCLQIQQTTLHNTSIGHIINLVSNDVFKFDFGSLYWNYLWVSPIIALLSLIIIISYVGLIGLVGVAYIILHSPLQIFFGYLFGILRLKQSETADKRIRLMNQVIKGMRIIKYYAWEAPFVKYISKIRKKEIRYASLSGITQSTNFSFFSTSLFVALFLTYFVSYEKGVPLSASQLGLEFIALNTLRTFLILLWGQSLFATRETVIALKRIQRVLECSRRNVNNKSKVNTEDVPFIHLSDFTASWKYNGLKDVTLKSINLHLKQFQFVVITGPIGSGKSSLLLSLIGELPGLSGHIQIGGDLSYASQEPWIFSGTIRDNILVGRNLYPERYDKVLEVCCLREDLDSFDEGDKTLIGERGVTLSGGQKARVSLARSVYHQADIYLFDDPLSAVDFKVGREIFEKCTNTFLEDKIVLLVTHQIQYAKKADRIIVMREGEVVTSGRYQEVIENEYCRSFLIGLEVSEEHHTNLSRKGTSKQKDCLLEDKEVNQYRDEVSTESAKETRQLTTTLRDEDYLQTSSSVMGYIRYFLAGGFGATIFLFVLTILSNGGLILAYWWMQSITQCVIARNISETNQSNETIPYPTSGNCPWYFNFYYLGSLRLLALFTFSGCLFTFLRGFNFYYIVLQASRRLHTRMLRRVMHAPIRFFDTNPSGRILNRFSKDFGFLDEQLPMLFYDFWQYSTYNFTIALAICLVQYYLLIPFSFLLVATLLLRYWYLKTCKQVKRLESIARSPLYTHISLALQGLTTIRCLNLETRITRDFHHFQDEHSRAWYHYIVCHKWFTLRLDFLTALVVIFAVFSTVISEQIFGKSELIEFSIPLLLSLPACLQYSVRISGDVDILMVSVDRILNYCKLKQETSNKIINHCGGTEIKRKGEIRFKNVAFKYAKNLPFTLHDVSFCINPGEKIGIIGRTGAGKSSFFNSLFLLYKISAGSITVDGKNISSLCLHEHRKRLSIIPQDPFLFSETLRYNLDPFEEFSSEMVWDALAKAHLQNMVQSLPDQLMTSVEEDGLNFSAGERQLLCLARAILRKNKIILIDEATANVDIRTDTLVQQAIRTHFSDCSVLTIAHRIETIIDSDKIMVLEKGRIVDFRDPRSMLENESSYLSSIITQLDLPAQMQLRNAAK